MLIQNQLHAAWSISTSLYIRYRSQELCPYTLKCSVLEPHPHYPHPTPVPLAVLERKEPSSEQPSPQTPRRQLSSKCYSVTTSHQLSSLKL